MIKKLMALISVLLLSFNLSPHAVALATANIKVRTVPTEVYENKPFNLIFQTFDKVDGPPDFSPIEKDFTIVQETQRNDFKMFSGDFTRSDNWVLEVIADHAGNITIPEISFGKDRSPSITINVIPKDDEQDSAEKDFISELEVSSTHVFVRSEIIVTQRMLSTRKTARPSFSGLKISGTTVMQEKLDEGKSFDTKREGKTYHVLEIKTALYPQQPGRLILEPSVAVAQVAVDGDGSVNPLMSNAVTKSATSTSIEVKIDPVPADFNERNWLPAKEVRLEEEWPDAQTNFNTGDPITHTIKVSVNGLGYTQLPKIPIEQVKNLKRYPDKPAGKNTISFDGISSSLTIREVLIPTHAGSYTLPAIKIPWWNTLENKREMATIPSRQIQVTGNKEISTSTNGRNQTSIAEKSRVVKPDEAELYKWLSVISVLGWITTIVLWFVYNRTRNKPVPSVPEQDQTGLQQLKMNLKKACKNALPQDCEKALLAWFRIFYNDPDITNLGALSRRVTEPLRSEIVKLERVLYSPNGGEWDPEKIWNACRKIDHVSSIQDNAPDLEPMYRY